MRWQTWVAGQHSSVTSKVEILSSDMTLIVGCDIYDAILFHLVLWMFKFGVVLYLLQIFTTGT